MPMRSIPFILCALLCLACDNGDDNVLPCPDPQQGTRYFRFMHDSGAQFVAWTNIGVVLGKVDAELSLPYDERTMHINGAILDDNRTCPVNPGWSWYFDPADWDLAEISIEVCDGNPQFVEVNLEDYLNIGRYCPWGSRVLEEIGKPF